MAADHPSPRAFGRPRSWRPAVWAQGRMLATLPGRLVVVEIAAFCLAAAVARQVAPGLTVAVAWWVIAVTVLAVGGWRGVSTWRSVGVGIAFVARGRRIDMAGAQGFPAVAVLTPDTAVRSFVDRSGTAMAVIRQRGSMGVVLELSPEHGSGLLRAATSAAIPLAAIHGPDFPPLPVRRSRVVLHTAARADVDGPARRLMWASLWRDVTDGWTAGGGPGTQTDRAMAALATDAARVSVRAGDHDVRVEGLTPHRLAQAQALVGGVVEPAAGRAGESLVEFWSGARVGALWHRTYWVRRWPRTSSLASIVDLLSGVSGAESVTVAVETEYSGPESGLVQVLVRTCCTQERLGALHDRLAELASGARLSLRVMDGSHGLGFAATMPVGGQP